MRQASQPGLQEAEGRQAGRRRHQLEAGAEVADVDADANADAEEDTVSGRAEVAAEQAEAAYNDLEQQGDQLGAAQEEDGRGRLSGGSRGLGCRWGLAEGDPDGRQVRAVGFLGRYLLRQPWEPAERSPPQVPQGQSFAWVPREGKEAIEAA